MNYWFYGKAEINGGKHLSVDRMYRDFNLTGREVEIEFMDAPLSTWNFFKIPAKVIDEHRKFITVEILPHHNPYITQGDSKSYTMCINKYRVWNGDVMVYVDGVRFAQ